MFKNVSKTSAVTDMTQGRPLSLLMRFSMPLMLTNALMVLYTFADSAIVGRILGVEAFAAVGATGMLYFMMFSIVLGLGQGFGIVIAQRFGAKDAAGLKNAFVTGIYLVIITGVILGTIGITCSRIFLQWLNTPQELMDGAVTYLTWTFGGIGITFASIYSGGVLRALGNSKTPLIATIVSSLINIALSLALVGRFQITGIAAATLFSQLVSCAYCLFMLHRSGVLSGCGHRWDGQSGKELLRMGLPLGLRNTVIQGGGVIVQWFINGYNDIALIAGISIAKRLYSLVMIPGGALDAANATFIAQNYGAGLLKRMKKGYTTAFWLMLGSAGIVMAILLPLSRVLLSLLFEGDPATVEATLDFGSLQLNIILFGLPLLHMLFLYRSALEGIGKPFIPTLSGFLELVFRIASLIILTPVFGRMGVLLSDTIGWVGATALLVISYYVIIRRLNKDEMNDRISEG